MNRFLLILAATLHVSVAWSIPNQLKAFGVAATLAASPMVANAADFNGSYSDPQHPNCKRIIEVSGNKATLSGTDGNPGCPADGSGNPWKLTGKISDGNKLSIDFSPKGGPSDVVGVLGANNVITFPDGNTWARKK